MAQRMRARARIPRGVLGVALVVFGLWVSLIALLVGLVPVSPDPYTPDGDPCCSVPDTWGEVQAGMAFGLLWFSAALIPFVTGGLLIAGAIWGRPIRWRWLPIGVATMLAAAAAAIVVVYERLDEVPQMARCREARPRVAAYRTATRGQQTELSRQIVDCGFLAGLSEPAVIAMLGPPAVRTGPDRERNTSRMFSERWYYGKRRIATEFLISGGESHSVSSWISDGRPGTSERVLQPIR